MDWAEKIKGLVERMQQAQVSPAGTIGLSAPGLASVEGRFIAYMPGRLHGLEGLDWTNYLQAPRLVPVLNDAHAALLGEAWLGAAKGYRHVIMLTLGTGVGGAAIVDGKLLLGHIGRAGHLGHTCLDPEGPPDVCSTPGSLEVAIGNWNIRERSQGRYHTTRQLVEAHLQGDPDATRIWMRSVKNLAGAICSFVNILDPEAVILGGGIARAGKALFEPLQRFLDPIEWRPGGHRVQILPAQLGDLAGAFGAAYNSKHPILGTWPGSGSIP
jgi:glucokinase